MAALSADLLVRIIHRAAKGDAEAIATCKAVCKDWRDSARRVCSKVVIAGEELALPEALRHHPQVTELEIKMRHKSKGGVSAEAYDVLSSIAWASVTLQFKPAAGPPSLATLLSASKCSLTSLVLENVLLEVSDLCCALTASRNLEKFSLGGQVSFGSGSTESIGPQEARFLEHVLSNVGALTSVKECHLSKFADLVTRKTIVLLPHSFPNLKILSFSDIVGLSKAAYVELARGLPHLRCLRVTGYSADNLNPLPSVMSEHCPLLEVLSMSTPLMESIDHCSSSLIQAVASLLKSCPSLTALKLPARVGKEDWPLLLPDMGSIIELGCSWDDIYSAPSLGTLTELSHLALADKSEWTHGTVMEDLYMLDKLVRRLPKCSRVSLRPRWLDIARRSNRRNLMPGVVLSALIYDWE